MPEGGLCAAAVRNPVTHLTAGAVALSLTSPSGRLADDGALSISYADGVPQPFGVTLHNTTQTPLWAALIDLTETYGVFTDAVLSGSVALEAGQSMTVALTGQVSDALWKAGNVTPHRPAQTLPSTIEFDPRSLEQGELELTLTPPEGGRATTRSMDQPAAGGWSLPWTAGAVNGDRSGPVTRRLGPQASPSTGADWRTDDAFVHTTRPRP